MKDWLNLFWNRMGEWILQKYHVNVLSANVVSFGLWPLLIFLRNRPALLKEAIPFVPRSAKFVITKSRSNGLVECDPDKSSSSTKLGFLVLMDPMYYCLRNGAQFLNPKILQYVQYVQYPQALQSVRSVQTNRYWRSVCFIRSVHSVHTL